MQLLGSCLHNACTACGGPKEGPTWLNCGSYCRSAVIRFEKSRQTPRLAHAFSYRLKIPCSPPLFPPQVLLPLVQPWQPLSFLHCNTKYFKGRLKGSSWVFAGTCSAVHRSAFQVIRVVRSSDILLLHGTCSVGTGAPNAPEAFLWSSPVR